MTRLAAGVVLYRTPVHQAVRLAGSLSVAAAEAGVEARLAVTDNSAAEGELPAMPEAADRTAALDLFASAGNVGFGRAQNRLMRAAFEGGADAFLALNPDGLLHPGAVRALLDLAADGPALVEARQFPNEHPKVYDPETLDTPWCSGACLLITREVFERVGGFDEGFFMYCEDVDLSWRVRLAGGRCRIAADAYFFHDVLDRSQTDAVRWHMALSMRRLAGKWAGAEKETVETRLRRMLTDVPGEVVKAGSASAEAPVDLGGRPSPADFSHHFGFAEFRWS